MWLTTGGVGTEGACVASGVGAVGVGRGVGGGGAWRRGWPPSLSQSAACWSPASSSTSSSSTPSWSGGQVVGWTTGTRTVRPPGGAPQSLCAVVHCQHLPAGAQRACLSRAPSPPPPCLIASAGAGLIYAQGSMARTQTWGHRGCELVCTPHAPHTPHTPHTPLLCESVAPRCSGRGQLFLGPLALGRLHLYVPSSIRTSVPSSIV